MGHKNYHNYSKPYNQDRVPEVTIEAAPEENVVTSEIPPVVDVTVPVPDEVIETIVETAPELPTTVAGVVSGCKKLNVRNRPSTTSAIVTTINEGTEIVIDQPAVYDEFYKVTLANGLAGYCMKKFITVK